MTDLTTLKNIGPRTIEWLHDVDVHNVEALRALGAVEVYVRLKTRYPDRVTLNALWGLAAALLDIDWRLLDADHKAELRAQVNAMLNPPAD